MFQIILCDLLTLYYCNETMLILQAYDDEPYALLSDVPTYNTDGALLFSNVNIHDVQCLAVYSCRGRRGRWILPIWLEEVCYCGCNRTLPLAYREKDFIKKSIYRRFFAFL